MKQFGLGVKKIFGVFKAVPYVIGEKREERRKGAEKREKEKAMKKKALLEEKLARQAADDDEGDVPSRKDKEAEAEKKA